MVQEAPVAVIQAVMEILLMEVAPIEMALITEISVALVVSAASEDLIELERQTERKSRECRQHETL